jgi:hypothetical protein
MDYLIIAKWLTDWSGREYGAPSVVTTVIDMALTQGHPSSPIDLPILATAELQVQVEQILMLIVVVSVPIMLCVKPFALYFSNSSHD